MKVKAVSALRSKRGLRPEVSREAEPQVVGLAPPTTNDRRANTMKTYILRDPKTVERQTSLRPLRVQSAARPAPPAVAAPGAAVFIGLDVHNDSIAVSLAPSNSPEVRRYGIIGGSHDDVLKLAKKLHAAHPASALRFCYEAGPRGYPLCRFLGAHGHTCILVAPSKVPRKP